MTSMLLIDSPSPQPSPEPPKPNFWRNLRDLPSAMRISALVAGFLVVLVGYTGPLLLVLQAAQQAKLSQEQAASWLWAITIGNGLLCMFLSVRYRQPLTAPWPTVSVALLALTLGDFSYNEVIGAYILTAIGIVLVGFSGLFGKLIALVPQPVVMGMLAGVLLRFGISIFTTLPERPALVLALMVAFYLLRRFKFPAPMLVVLILGVVISGLNNDLKFPSNLALSLTVPIFTAPIFTLNGAINLALPLFVLALTGQYAPGQAVLRSSGYTAPMNGILVITGGFSVIAAFFGSHGLTLGALTAAMVTNADAHPDPEKRYSAGVSVGIWYTLFGLFGTTVTAVFSGFPASLVSTIAGLSLSSTISNSLAGGLAEPKHRDSALMAFLCTASNITLFGIGAPFWALLIGVFVSLLMNGRWPTRVPQKPA
jgi:benzoate membrane transport protein